MTVPAIDLTTLQQELIEKAVAEHGRGLLVLGGENSFGPGGYYETPLERISPLSSRVPRDAPRVALVFVLDRSGSMQRNEGGATRLEIAKQATVSAIRLLHQESLIAIVAFDSEAKVLLPLQPAKDSTAVTRALRELEPGGGTAIHPGLVEALRQLEGVDAMAKHIVVMSDGLTQPGDFPGILKAISDRGISVSTVAIGEGADPVRLEEIARIGKGAFHATQDFKALPSILSQEALLLSGKPVEERLTTPGGAERGILCRAAGQIAAARRLCAHDPQAAGRSAPRGSRRKAGAGTAVRLLALRQWPGHRADDARRRSLDQGVAGNGGISAPVVTNLAPRLFWTQRGPLSPHDAARR
jgi:uncharacterized protein YegL